MTDKVVDGSTAVRADKITAFKVSDKLCKPTARIADRFVGALLGNRSMRGFSLDAVVEGNDIRDAASLSLVCADNRLRSAECVIVVVIVAVSPYNFYFPVILIRRKYRIA